MREGHEHKWARQPAAAQVSYTYVIYGLQALGALVGLVGGFSEVGKFAFGIPPAIAVAMNYLRRESVRGSYLASHFRWQIRSFWFALALVLVALVVAMPLTLFLVGSYIVDGAVMLASVWVGYRVVRGVLALRARRPMPFDPPPVTIDT